MTAFCDNFAFTIADMAKKRSAKVEKKVPVGGRIEPAMLAQLQALADADQRTVSFFVERAIREFLANQAKKHAHK